MIELTFHTDPGHGWLQVPKSELEKYGIADKVSRYSYMKNDSAFLEEDCDAQLYTDALDAAGVNFDVNETYAENTPIRRYMSYRPTKRNC